MKVAISGGGTGGHVYPALALIRELKKVHPDAEFLYIGTEKGLEAGIVKREGIPFEAIEITGFKRSLSLENIKTVMRFLSGAKKVNKFCAISNRMSLSEQGLCLWAGRIRSSKTQNSYFNS